MDTDMSGTALALAAVLIVAGCTSPETKRTRGGGAGADVGNRGSNVELHEGAEPYYQTPQLIASEHALSGRSNKSEQASRK
jgi:hypothetical protein